MARSQDAHDLLVWLIEDGLHRPTWDGARNAADLGGLPLVGGGTTTYGRIFRSAAPEWMTTSGWEAARAAGLRCVVDLRNEVECGRSPEHPVVDEGVIADISVVRAPTEDPDDPAFLEECGAWLDHPRSWTPNMRRYPEKFAHVFSSIAAGSSEGAVLIHCAGGRDRTGLISSILLALAGAEPTAIVANYEGGFRGAGAHRGHGLSYDPSAGEWVETPRDEWSAAELDAALADRRPAVLQWLRETDVAAYLLEAGVDADSLDLLRHVLLD